MASAMDTLAILGGRPVASIPAPPSRKLSAAAIARAVRLFQVAGSDADRLSGAAGDGIVSEFERAFAQYVEAPHAVAMSSGGTALVTALIACDVRPGDEVIVAPYGWGGTVGAILAIGATPVFADIESRTWNLDPASVEAGISDRTRAILATHLFGHPADMQGLRALAERHGIALICDAAQALGATYGGRGLGAWGDITTFSFGRGKILTTGEGGMLVTANRALYERAIVASQHPLRAFAEVDDRSLRMLVDEVGLSFRMHPLAAALGLGELAALPARLALRRETCNQLRSALHRTPGFQPPQELQPARHSFHRFVLAFHGEELGGLPRPLAVRALQAEGVPIAMGPVCVPIHRRPRFSAPVGRQAGALHGTCRLAGALPVTADQCARELVLDAEPDWLEARVPDVARAFEKVALHAGALRAAQAPGFGSAP